MATTFEAERLNDVDELDDWTPLVELNPRTTEPATIIDLSHGVPVDVEATLNDLYAAIDTAAARMGRTTQEVIRQIARRDRVERDYSRRLDGLRRKAGMR